MTPSGTKASSTTDEASPVKGKVVVTLPAETCAELDTLGAALSDKLEQQTGVAIALSRPQIIQAVVKKAYELQQALAEEDNAEGDITPDE